MTDPEREERPPPQPSPGVPGERADAAASLLDVAAKIRTTLHRLGPAAPLAIATMTLPAIGFAILAYVVSTTPLTGIMRMHPQVAWSIYVVAFWLLGICTLPTYAYSMVGGYVFGFWGGLFGTFFAYLGAMSIAFAIARRIASARVMPLIDEHPTLRAVRAAVIGSGPLRGTLLIALLRISPASPFAITNFVLGAGGVGWLPYVLGSTLGVLPRTAVAVYFAAKLETLEFKSVEGWWVFGLGIAATVVVIIVIGRLARKELDRQLGR